MITEKPVKTILRKGRKHIDSWFCASYQVSPYKGCQHACVYCDGRFEKYGFTGEFGEDVEVKINAAELLPKEIKRIKIPGYVMLGSGITDAYQTLELRYSLTRSCLEIIAENDLPVHILTKSAHVERDFDLLTHINERSGTVLSFSIAFANEDNRKLLEPRTAPLASRWRILREAKERGFGTGVMMIPVIPFVSDSSEEMEAIVHKAVEAKVDFVMFGGMTLKSGRQKDFFLDFLKRSTISDQLSTQGNKQDLLARYEQLYEHSSMYGEPDKAYVQEIEKRFAAIARAYKLAIRMPQKLLTGRMPLYTEAALMLSHIREYLLLHDIKRSAYSYADSALQKWAYEQTKKISRKKDFDYRLIEQKFRDLVISGEVKKLAGIGAKIAALLREFVETGRMRYYEDVSMYQVK